jgi:quinol-cytochrome oxidoreductase complex cytochrome b subunit
VINGAFLGGVIIPGILVSLLTIWPWLDKSPMGATGLWLPRDRRTQNLVFLIIAVIVVALTVIGTFMRGPGYDFYWPWQAWPSIPSRI